MMALAVVGCFLGAFNFLYAMFFCTDGFYAKPKSEPPAMDAKTVLCFFLCAAFATLLPWQPAQARPEEVQVDRTIVLANQATTLQAFLEKSGTELVDVSLGQLAADPRAVILLGAAEAEIIRAAANAGYDLGDGFQVSLAPPPGVNAQAIPEGVFMVSGSDAQCVPWLLLCVRIVIVIVILGVAYYVYRKVCKILDNALNLSNRNYQLTNEQQVIVEEPFGARQFTPTK
jgi:hypothetical protein